MKRFEELVEMKLLTMEEMNELIEMDIVTNVEDNGMSYYHDGYQWYIVTDVNDNEYNVYAK